MKKILLVFLVIVVIAGGAFLVLNQSANKKFRNHCINETGKDMNCAICLFTGNVIAFSFGQSCEIPAKDAGKVCVFDDECTKKNCIYKSQNDTIGFCDGFFFGGRECHRERSKNVECEEIYTRMFNGDKVL